MSSLAVISWKKLSRKYQSEDKIANLFNTLYIISIHYWKVSNIIKRLCCDVKLNQFGRYLVISSHLLNLRNVSILFILSVKWWS